MNDITNAFRLYREVTRSVWNFGLRQYPRGELEFIPVDTNLFTAMVASQTEGTLVVQERQGITYFPDLKVILAEEIYGEPALLARPGPDSTVWRPVTNLEGVELRYSSLFDFCLTDGVYREFRYVHAVDVQTNSEIRRFLIDAHKVRLMDLSAVP